MTKDNEFVQITKDEAASLADFIEGYLLDHIREDIYIDSMQWLSNIVHVYDKVKATTEDKE